MSDLHPTAGARLVLELDDSDELGARYDASIFTPDARYDCRFAILAKTGDVTIVPAENEPAMPPVWAALLLSMARMMARQTLADSPTIWPRRLCRWRDR